MKTPKQTKATLADALTRWFASHARDLPWRRTRDPYAIWVSEIMLQQTQVKTVIPYWERWMLALPDIPSLAKADDQVIHKLWEGLGYYSRARNLRKAAQQILTNHQGRFPSDYDHVLALPGIGPYTAGAICSIAFAQPKPILDGNVIRVLARVFGIRSDTRETSTRRRLWALAEEIVLAAPENPGALNQALMELGATVCTPTEPKCSICPVKTACYALKQNQTKVLPNTGKRLPATPRLFFAFVVKKNGKFLVSERSGKVVNTGLWEFPNIEVPLATDSPNDAAARLFVRAKVDEGAPRLKIRHTITRFQITLLVYHARLRRGSNITGTWASPEQLSALAFSSAHRRIANALLAGLAARTS